MKIGILFDDNGLILESVISLKIPENYTIVDADIDGMLDTRDFYYDILTSNLVKIPECPSPNHVFNYITKQWFDPRTSETQWPVVRAERDRRLLASDWTQLPDVPLATKEAWATYRQALRDITLQSDPFNIIWPEPPQ